MTKREKSFEVFHFKITRHFIPEELIQMGERYLAVMCSSVSALVIKANFLGIALVVLYGHPDYNKSVANGHSQAKSVLALCFLKSHLLV